MKKRKKKKEDRRKTARKLYNREVNDNYIQRNFQGKL